MNFVASDTIWFENGPTVCASMLHNSTRRGKEVNWIVFLNKIRSSSCVFVLIITFDLTKRTLFGNKLVCSVIFSNRLRVKWKRNSLPMILLTKTIHFYSFDYFNKANKFQSKCHLISICRRFGAKLSTNTLDEVAFHSNVLGLLSVNASISSV